MLLLLILLGDGMRLTPALATDTELKLDDVRALPESAVEIVYDCA